LDLTTNKDGNHLVVWDFYFAGIGDVTWQLKYYLVNSSGTLVRSYIFETLTSGTIDIDFPSIAGDNDRIYTVYKHGNLIKTRKSTNSGQSWTNIADIAIGNNTCNSVDITFGKYDNALHVVWATQDAGKNYKTYYKRLPSSDQWDQTENVTDGSNVGGFSTVSTSDNRVHFGYNTGTQWDPETNIGDAKTRDKIGIIWQNPQLVFSTNSMKERIFAGSSKLFDFYYEAQPYPFPHANLNVKERNFQSVTWSSPFLIQEQPDMDRIDAANTVDGQTHIVYPGFLSVLYRFYHLGVWSDPPQEIGDFFVWPKISAVSNDLFVVRYSFGVQGNFIKYRQYDAVPLAPTGLTITEDANNHPQLDWDESPEPDRAYYKIYRYDSYGGGWQYLCQTTGTTFTDETLTYCHAIPPAQCPNVRRFFFRITVVDDGSYESGPSNQVAALLVGGPPSKAIVNDPNNEIVTEYSLSQNYPNPFNPNTTIDYSIKSSGLATLKVYDMLGTEVASLVNENKEAGNYSVEFNASELPSGIYFYTLTAGNFRDTKKLILMK